MSTRPASIYLDYNATTPLDPGVREVMVRALDEAWGNPSSVHRLGREARAQLDDARDRVSAVLRCRPSEVIFTSGGTEANNLAVIGAARLRRDRGRHLVSSPVEHHAVLHALEHLVRREGFLLTLLPVDGQGRIAPEDVRDALRPDTVLVSVMAANNETGTRQPVGEIGRLCRSRGVLFHCDAVQWFGKEPLSGVADLDADLVTLCGHKLHGPKGVGALYARSPLLPEPLLFGGAQENDRRAGTENLPAILGLAEAVSRFVPTPVFATSDLRAGTEGLARVLERIEGVAIQGSRLERLSNTLAFTVTGTDSIALLANLDLAGICASSGSACSSGSLTPSHVLRAQGLSESLAASLVRLSLGRENTPDELATVAAALPGVIDQARRR